MMGQFKKEWDELFIEEMTSYETSGEILDGRKVVVINEDIFLGTTKVYCGTKLIIDDVLIWCSNITYTSILQMRVKVFKKFIVSFCQEKYHFLLDRVEYVGHDLLLNRNCPAK